VNYGKIQLRGGHMKDENKPFNDVIDHFNKIEGNAANLAKTDIKKLPKPIRYIGYFMIGFLVYLSC
jgi:hypothetical protein